MALKICIHPKLDTYNICAEPVTSDNHLGAASGHVEQYSGGAQPHYVMGPMVVRVMPDGRPVPEDKQRPLPVDEDAEEFQAMRARPVPSMADLIRHAHATDSRRVAPQPSVMPSQ